MATVAWQLSGQYYETCSCDFVCPCVPGQKAVSPTKGSCTFCHGLSGRSWDLRPHLARWPWVRHLRMDPGGDGEWKRLVGVIVDERANLEQREANTAIASGSAGGPMSVLAALVGKFLGVESAPSHFERSGVKWSVKASDLVDMASEGAMRINPNVPEPLNLDNTGHPAAHRFALARSLKSHVHALGLSRDDESGWNDGQYAPFSWRNSQGRRGLPHCPLLLELH